MSRVFSPCIYDVYGWFLFVTFHKPVDPDPGRSLDFCRCGDDDDADGNGEGQHCLQQLPRRYACFRGLLFHPFPVYTYISTCRRFCEILSAPTNTFANQLIIDRDHATSFQRQYIQFAFVILTKAHSAGLSSIFSCVQNSSPNIDIYVTFRKNILQEIRQKPGCLICNEVRWCKWYWT